MKISVETFTLTGSRHLRKNEENHDSSDFGTSDNGTFWAVVSDGCSSARYPRQGADDVVAAVRKVLSNVAGPITDARVFESLLLDELDAHGYVNPLHYCATAVVLQMHQGKAHVFFYGDGSLLLRNRDGLYTEIGVHYSANAPRFLHYFAKSKFSFLSVEDKLSPRWSDFVYPPQDAHVLKKSIGTFVTKSQRTELPLESPYALEIDLKSEDIWNLLICSDGVTDTRESLGKALLAHPAATGIAQACDLARSQEGFIPPSDDATFINVALA